ncbi:hypothetical protein R6Q59_024013 [Mikania micrantha]
MIITKLRGTDAHNSQSVNNDDPFADVSFHGQNIREEHQSVDIFSGLATVYKSSESQSELFDLFGSKNSVNGLMASLSVTESESSPSQNETTQKESLETMFSDSSVKFNPQMNDVLSNMLQFQGHGVNPNAMLPMMLNPMSFSSQQINNYAVMSNLFAQQQFLSTMNSLQSQNLGPASSSSALPDIFNSIISSQTPTSTMNGSKKDDTKAFDFISDHLAAARDPKRVT